MNAVRLTVREIASSACLGCEATGIPYRLIVELTPPWDVVATQVQPDDVLSIVDPVIDGATVRLGPTSLVVVLPDIVVDTTDAADCMVGTLDVPLLHHIQRSTARAPSTAATFGSLVNTVLDLLVETPDLTDAEAIRRAERSRPLALAALAAEAGQLTLTRNRLLAMVPALRQGLAQVATRRLTVEPTICSPILGLQGRLDLLAQDVDDPHRVDILELKSSTAPADGSVNAAHEAQVTAYNLLLRSIRPHRHGRNIVWYAAATATPFRDVACTSALERRLIMLRNAIVVSDRSVAARGPSPLADVARLVDERQLPAYLRQRAQAVARTMGQLDAVERLYLRVWSSFLVKESHHQRLSEGGMADLWRQDIAAKRLSPTALTDLQPNPDASDLPVRHLRFRRTQPTDTALRRGDLVVCYPLAPDGSARPVDDVLCKATVRDILPAWIEVSLRNKQAQLDTFTEDRRWVIEQDVTDSGLRLQHASLMAWAAQPSWKRRIMLGLERPRTTPLRPLTCATGLFPQQERVVTAALAARDWFLIQGPPGTGKTSTVIRSLVQELMAAPHERLLLLAFTNRAADELCDVVARCLGPDSFVRLGSKDGTAARERHVHHLADNLDTEAVAGLLGSTRCLVATVAAMQASVELQRFGPFTTAIVDEASQVVEPQILGIVADVDRFILVGDECQLPAVITQPTESLSVSHPSLADLGLEDLRTSYFERLMACAVRQGWGHAIGRLREQGRMHTVIGTAASDLSYGGTLTTIAPWQSTMAPWVDDDRNPTVARILNDRLVAIDADAAATPAFAADLADAIVRLVPDRSIGIITPFRTLNNAIADRLSADVRAVATVDTIERFQGSERDIVIFAPGIATTAELEAMTSERPTAHGVVDRKLNVALTRAREAFVLIGPFDLLSLQRPYATLLATCRRHPRPCLVAAAP